MQSFEVSKACFGNLRVFGCFLYGFSKGSLLCSAFLFPSVFHSPQSSGNSNSQKNLRLSNAGEKLVDRSERSVRGTFLAQDVLSDENTWRSAVLKGIRPPGALWPPLGTRNSRDEPKHGLDAAVGAELGNDSGGGCRRLG